MRTVAEGKVRGLFTSRKHENLVLGYSHARRMKKREVFAQPREPKVNQIAEGHLDRDSGNERLLISLELPEMYFK